MTEVVSTELTFNETARSSKCKINSLSSVLGEEKIKNRDKLGLKKFAKACRRPFRSEESKPMEANEQIRTQATVATGIDSSKRDSLSLLQLTKHLKNSDLLEDHSNWRSFFDYNFNSQEGAALTPREKYTSHHQVYENTANSQLKKSTNVLGQNHSVLNTINIKTTNSKIEFEISVEGRRVIRLKDFPSFIGLKSVISQVCGGPLERILLLNSSQSDGAEKHLLKDFVLELWFLKSEDARDFLDFSYSGLFLINGFHIKPTWAPATSREHFHDLVDEDLEHEMSVNGARRCLILKNYRGKRSKSSSMRRQVPSSKGNYFELDLAEIKVDFAKFGEILEISPVISKRLCIAIHYFQTVSAIEAKREYDNYHSSFYQKYQNWTLWYGKDPVDRPCICP